MGLPIGNKKEIVIELYKKGENRRNIAKGAHLSFSSISKIINEYEGQKQPKPKASNTALAFKLFSEGVGLTDVTIKLDISPSEVEKIYSDYLRLGGKSAIAKHFAELGEYIPHFWKFVDIMRNCKPEKEKILELYDYDSALKIQQKQMADNFREKLKGK